MEGRVRVRRQSLEAADLACHPGRFGDDSPMTCYPTPLAKNDEPLPGDSG